MLLLVLVILAPVELSFRAGGLFITSSKLFLLIWTFIVIPKAFQLKLAIYDWLFIGHVAWSALAFLLTFGTAGVEASGTYVLEFLIVYLTARVYLRDVSQLKAIVGALCLMAALATALALPEALMHKRYLHDFFRSITGIYYRIDYDSRMGIMRAASLFEHPILFGIFCSSLVSLAWFSSTTFQRCIRLPILGFGTFLSASSAPLLIFMLQIWLIGIEKASRSLQRRVMVLGSIAGGLALLLENGTGRGIVGTLALITLNPGTTYTRRTQWQHGIDDVMAHPFFGFDPTQWTRPDWLAGSVDNYWLLMMMRSGIPSIVLLGLAAVFIWIALARREATDERFRGLRIGWGLMMITMILGGATVAYFGKLQPLFAFYMGFGAALANCAMAGGGQTAEAPATAPAYTRFKGPALPLREKAAPAWARGAAPVARIQPEQAERPAADLRRGGRRPDIRPAAPRFSR